MLLRNPQRELIGHRGEAIGRVHLGSRRGLTIVEIRDGSQNMAARIERLWSANPPGGIPTREQDNFRVGERSRSDSIVQCLTEGKCGGHAVKVPVRFRCWALLASWSNATLARSEPHNESRHIRARNQGAYTRRIS